MGRELSRVAGDHSSGLRVGTRERWWAGSGAGPERDPGSGLTDEDSGLFRAHARGGASVCGAGAAGGDERLPHGERGRVPGG